MKVFSRPLSLLCIFPMYLPFFAFFSYIGFFPFFLSFLLFFFLPFFLSFFFFSYTVLLCLGLLSLALSLFLSFSLSFFLSLFLSFSFFLVILHSLTSTLRSAPQRDDAFTSRLQPSIPDRSSSKRNGESDGANRQRLRQDDDSRPDAGSTQAKRTQSADL